MTIRHPRRGVPPPHLVPAPPPELWGDRPLPYETEPGPAQRSCRQCGRVDRHLEAELAAAREAFTALDELLGRLRESAQKSDRARELAEREATTLSALVAEFDAIAGEHERVLAAANHAVVRARNQRDRARRERAAERQTVARLTAEIKMLKATPAARRAAAARAETELAAAVAAAGALEMDSRLLDLEAALASERAHSERFARYVGALEARLRALADAELPAPVGSASE